MDAFQLQELTLVLCMLTQSHGLLGHLDGIKTSLMSVTSVLLPVMARLVSY